MGDGVYDDLAERTLHGATVELYDSSNVLVATAVTGKFSAPDTIAQGWQEPYTWPPNEIGGVFAGPATFDGSDPAAPRVGMYEFRNLAPGNYVVKIVPPLGYTYSPPTASSGIGTTVVVSESAQVDLGANTTRIGDSFGVPLAGETEGGVFDDVGPLDPRTDSLLWDEKAGIVGAPVGVYDHNNYFLGVMFMGDPMCYTGSTACTRPTGVTPVLGQKPEAERRFAPGVHRFLGNDPGFCEDLDGNGVLDPGEDINDNGNLDCSNAAYGPMELPYVFPQGGYKFEADWSLIPAVAAAVDICATDIAVSNTGMGYPWGASAEVTVYEDTGTSPGVPARTPVKLLGMWSTGQGGEAITNTAGVATFLLEQVEPSITSNLTFTVSGVTGSLVYTFNSANTTIGDAAIGSCLAPPKSPVIPNPGDFPPSTPAVLAGPIPAMLGVVLTPPTGLPCNTSPTPFTDIAGSFAAADIACTYNLRITTGVTGTTFSPQGEVVRGQMAAFLARAWRVFGRACNSSPTPFADIAGSFAAADIACIYHLGITSGITGTNFAPDEKVTREQMAAFLARIWRALGGVCDTSPTPFTDIAGSFAAADIACTYNLGVTTGMTPLVFSPSETTSREQTASFLARFWHAATSAVL